MDTKKLRQKILDLAIHGKLVPQDPNDEPASVLLERIRAEKEKLIKEGKIKKSRKTSSSSDTPHYEQELPSGWSWTIIGDLFQHNNGKQKSSANKEGVMLDYITTSNVYWGKFELTDVKQMAFGESEREKCTAKYGDLLVCEGGDIGRAAIWNYDYPICIQNHLHRLRPYIPLCTKYFLYSLMYSKITGNIKGKGIGLMSLSSNDLHNIMVALPPLAEQYRIVNAVDRLFSLIETIECSRNELYNTIAQLQKTILSCAIHGRLVPQNPEDEPASELLKRINPKAEITCDNAQYGKLPNGWCICRLEQVAEILDNLRKPINSKERELRKMNTPKKELYPYYGATGQVDVIDDYLLDGKYLLLGEDGAPFLDKYAPKSYIINGKSWVNNHSHILSPKINIDYLKFYLNSVDYSLYVNGSTRLKLTQSDMRSISIILPPLNEQHRIVKKIEELYAQLDRIESSLQA